jgi:hypothetical protein
MYIVQLFAEKTTRFLSSQVPVPNWLGDIIFYFKEKLRPSLNPGESESLWINSRSKPLGNMLIMYYLI